MPIRERGTPDPGGVGGEKYNLDNLKKYRKPPGQRDYKNNPSIPTRSPASIPGEDNQPPIVGLLRSNYPQFRELVSLYRKVADEPENKEHAKAYVFALLKATTGDRTVLLSLLAAGITAMYLFEEDKKNNESD